MKGERLIWHRHHSKFQFCCGRRFVMNTKWNRGAWLCRIIVQETSYKDGVIRMLDKHDTGVSFSQNPDSGCSRFTTCEFVPILKEDI